MDYKKGIVHLFPLILIAALVITGWFLVFKFLLKGKLPFGKPKQPTVELKTEYKNPFDKKSQYVNPIDQFKNPFTTLR